LKDTPKKLNIRQLRQLSDYCLLNAQKLQESAEILFNHHLYSVSVLTSILAIEELGKRHLMFSHVFVIDNDEKRKKWWAYFRKHKDKIYWAFHDHWDAITLKSIKPNDYPSFLEKQHQEEESFAAEIDHLKQRVTYVDFQTQLVNPRKTNKTYALIVLKLSKQLLDYHIKNEPTDKIITYCKNAKKKRFKGESLSDFVGRLYLSDSTTKVRAKQVKVGK